MDGPAEKLYTLPIIKPPIEFRQYRTLAAYGIALNILLKYYTFMLILCQLCFVCIILNCFIPSLNKMVNKRKKYANFINFTKFKDTTQRHELRLYLAYMNSKNNVKCIRCNGNAELWNPSKGCPICGNVLEKQDNYMFFTD